VSAALKGCPLLDELQIQLYHPFDRIDVGSDSDDVRDVVGGLPEDEVINASVFGDTFCEELSTSCPLVSSFAIVELAARYNSSYLVPITTFTDRGLMARTRLKFLQYLELRSISCTGAGVLEFLNSLSDEFAGKSDVFHQRWRQRFTADVLRSGEGLASSNR
jgi:hypothetical protein